MCLVCQGWVAKNEHTERGIRVFSAMGSGDVQRDGGCGMVGQDISRGRRQTTFLPTKHVPSPLCQTYRGSAGVRELEE